MNYILTASYGGQTLVKIIWIKPTLCRKVQDPTEKKEWPAKCTQMTLIQRLYSISTFGIDSGNNLQLFSLLVTKLWIFLLFREGFKTKQTKIIGNFINLLSPGSRKAVLYRVYMRMAKPHTHKYEPKSMSCAQGYSNAHRLCAWV